MAWWRGELTGEDVSPVEAYAEHLAAIRDRLPPDLLATEEVASLHDCRPRGLRLVPAEGSLSIELEGHAGDERFVLAYDGVERFESTADPSVRLGGPGGYGDLGYTEVDAQPDGTFEHRLIFSTGIEWTVVFRGFRMWKDEPARP